MSVVKFKNYAYFRGPKGDKGDKGDPGTGIVTTSGRITYNPTTKTVGFNETGLATQTYVDTALSSLVDNAPELLNTLNELAAAIGDNANFIVDITADINSKLSLSGGTMTGDLILSGSPANALSAATKQYVDDAISAIPMNTDDVIEGTTNLYFTDSRARSAISVTGAGSYDSSTGIINIVGGVTSVNGQNGTVVLDTGDVAEGTNLYFTNLRARTAISVAGDLSYNSTTGVISYTTPAGFSGDYNDLTNRPDINLNYVLTNGNTTTQTAVIPFHYASQATFPNPVTYHGAIAHSHSDGAMYFAHAGSWNRLSNQSELSTVATSGNYNDLINKPSIPSLLTDLNIVDGSLGQVLTTDGAGNFSFTTPDSGPGSWDDFIFDGGEFTDVDGDYENNLSIVDGGILDPYYNPANLADWSGTPPTTLAEAVDRLAAIVKTLNGGVGA